MLEMRGGAFASPLFFMKKLLLKFFCFTFIHFIILALCKINFAQYDSVVIEDIFGRNLNAKGIILVDWEGYIANPAIKLFIKPPLNSAFPAKAILSSNEPRLYFNLPSSVSSEGPRKTIKFDDPFSKKSFYISIFPDRDGKNEEYWLNIKFIDANGEQKNEKIKIYVIDQDKENTSLLFNIMVDFSHDKTGFFDDPLKRKIIRQAAEDWAYFIDDMNLDTVQAGEETTWIWNSDGFKTGYYTTNKFPYKGFLLYAYGIHHNELRCGGEPSSAGGFQRSLGKPLPLKRSGGIEIEIKGNYNTLGWFLTKNDDDWWYSKNTKKEQNDLYSIAHHEIGHALFFNPAYPKFSEFKSIGYVQDSEVLKYHGSYPKIDSNDHFSGEVDNISGKGAFGNEYHGLQGVGMPLGRWIITKLDLLCAQAIGYKLRKTSPFISLSIIDKDSPQGIVGIPYTYKMNAKGGIPFYYWSIESGSLPPGLSIDSFNGVISGIPDKEGVYIFTINVQDYNNLNASLVKTITINHQKDTSITIISPNGGEKLEIGSFHSIRWESKGKISFVKITYSTDGGKSFKLITPLTLNNGIYNWKVPESVSSNCLIKITDVEGKAVDASDSVFSIFQPIYPPLNFHGIKVENRSLFHREYINILKWEANPKNKNVIKYRIYQIERDSQKLLVELDANIYEYLHRSVEKNKMYTYAIVSVNNENEESRPIYTTVE